MNSLKSEHHETMTKLKHG